MITALDCSKVMLSQTSSLEWHSTTEDQCMRTFMIIEIMWCRLRVT